MTGLRPRAARPPGLARRLLRRHWPLAVVLAAYVGSTLIVPWRVETPVSDDWVYLRSVQILVHHHELRILDLTVTTLVFQVLWGALFAAVLGVSTAALRLSTIVLVLIAGGAVYATCRRLGVDERRSGLATAAYLFNPIAYVLGFTFMSDPVFTALLAIATYLYLRGLDTDVPAPAWVVAGSAIAACAFLVRQQGALIPVAVLGWLLATRRLRLAGVLQVAAVPMLAGAAYYLWLATVGVPEYQKHFLDSWVHAGAAGVALQARRLVFIEVAYAGFFALPLVAALLGARRLAGGCSPVRAGVFVATAATVLTGLVVWRRGPYFPYAPQFLGPSGLGPTDNLGARPALVPAWGPVVASVVVAVAAVLLAALLLARRADPAPGRSLLGALLAGQALGVFAPSMNFLHWPVPTLDRYLLPLLPLVVCLGAEAVRGVRVSVSAGAAVAALFAVFAVAGTRDFLVYWETVWRTSARAVAAGVPQTKLDGGADWSGLHLYEYGKERGLVVREHHPTWWHDVFAPAMDGTYVVANAPIDGFDVLWRVPYSSWLQTRPTAVYLLRWQGTGNQPR